VEFHGEQASEGVLSADYADCADYADEEIEQAQTIVFGSAGSARFGGDLHSLRLGGSARDIPRLNPRKSAPSADHLPGLDFLHFFHLRTGKWARFCVSTPI
jgi:hypothetical protein